jgi:hypothetical protein
LKLLSKFVCSALLLFLSLTSVWADAPAAALRKLFPAKLGEFRQVAPPKSSTEFAEEGLMNADLFSSPIASVVVAGYRDQNGRPFTIELIQFQKDSEAYSFFTVVARELRNGGRAGEIGFDGKAGTASVNGQKELVFFKGNSFIQITSETETGNAQLAQLFADTLDKGEGDTPALLRHLPDWSNAQKRAVFFTNIKSAQAIAQDQPVLTFLDTAGGDADAVLAEYGQARMLLIEFNTPQLAGDNDRMIGWKIGELKSQNQKVPTAYRRVGNYGVFVFDAESQQAANKLIDQVTYEQVVQWLGDNPYWFKEAEKRYVNTTLGVLVAVVKASGLVIVSCFGIGGLIGGVLFLRRRARQTTAEAFSDAGGMLRLNLDEITPQTDTTRLLSERN